jgi:hypothetical protein
MSSPKGQKARPAAPKAATPVAKVARRVAKPASDEGMSGQDKANFIKAMMEGVGGANGKAKKSLATPAGEQPKRVEILRKIPAASRTATPSNPESDEARKFAAMLEAKFAEGRFGVLTPEATQALMTALCKLYSANMEAGNKFPLVKDRMSITGTDAMIVCGALLKAVDLQVFELGMWQSWSGV